MSRLKEDFLWGGALSNVQAEGAYLEDGKGLNVYDTFVRVFTLLIFSVCLSVHKTLQ